MKKETARDIIGILIVVGAIISLFVSMTEAGTQLIRILAGVVVGYYFSIKKDAIVGLLKGKMIK